jgi:nicotinamide riboside transporter PnuC
MVDEELVRKDAETNAAFGLLGTLTKIDILMFVPYNTLAFKFIPPSVRPLTHALMSAIFNVAVSAVTLGYFDQWCASAMHLFS